MNRLISKSAILLLLAIFTVSCDAGETEAESNVGNGAVAQTEGNVTTEDIAEDTEDYIGQTVTIRSDALQTIEPATFAVEDQAFFGGENIVVVNASGEPFVLPETDAEVQITGEVTKFVLADVESVYNLDLDPDLYVDYEDKPAIIAQSLALAPEPGEITSNPTEYYGETLAVTGEIEEVYGRGVFTLDEDELFGGEDLLVIVNSPVMTSVYEGETVAVTGELRSFVVADIDRDYDLDWDLDLQQELEVEYSDRSVLIVDKVYPSAIPEDLVE